MSELAGQNTVPKPQNDIGVSASNPISSDNGEMKPSDLLSSHNHPQNKNLSKSSFSHYSPLSTRYLFSIGSKNSYMIEIIIVT